MPIEETQLLQISSIEASADRGGWQANCAVINDDENVVYGRRAEIYNLLEGDGTWNADWVLSLQGSMLPKARVFDRKQSNLQLIISTTDAFLTNAGLQGIYFSEQPVPANPHQMVNLNLGKIVEHIIEQHTNVSDQTAGGWVDTSGIDTINSTSVDVYTVRASNSIWQAIKSIADNEFYVRYFTKRDEFIYEPHPQFKTVIPDPVIDFNSSNIVGQPEITFREDIQVDQVQAYALTDTGVILQSFYPANVGTEGRRQKFTSLRCNSQARLNLLAERALKFLNREYNVRLTIPNVWGAYLEMYDRVSITYTGTAINGVSVDWSAKPFWVTDIRMDKIGNHEATTEIGLDEENL